MTVKTENVTGVGAEGVHRPHTGGMGIGRFLVEIEGPGVTPTNLNAAAALELAAAYTLLLQRIAQGSGHEPKFCGLHIEDKCAAIAVDVDHIEIVLAAAEEAQPILTGAVPAPHGLVGLTDRIQNAIKRLPIGQTASVIVGEWKREISRATELSVGSPWASLAVRATPVRIGGGVPAARFSSRSESEEFTLRLDSAVVARKLGALLYTEVEIEARVLRDADGTIERGELRTFSRLDSGNALDAWREWFRSAGSEWNEIEDVEGELDNDDDND